MQSLTPRLREPKTCLQIQQPWIDIETGGVDNVLDAIVLPRLGASTVYRFGCIRGPSTAVLKLAPGCKYFPFLTTTQLSTFAEQTQSSNQVVILVYTGLQASERLDFNGSREEFVELGMLHIVLDYIKGIQDGFPAAGH